MFLDKDNIFDTPRLRYNKLREEFYRKYLNPKAWRYRCDTKELAQAYHDLIEYLEKTEHFRCLTPSLGTDIPTDNINLVLHELPLPLKRREELIEFVVSGKSKVVEQSQETELQRIKEYLEMKKRGALVGVERRSNMEIEDYRREAKSVHADEDAFAQVNAQETAEVKEFERNKMENEILEIRQKVYSKLHQGLNVFSIVKKFKRKVEIFLRNYELDLSYVEQKHWRDKVIITEKAVNRYKKELKVQRDYCSRNDENIAPNVKELFDAARAQELIIENLPEPPDVDEIEEKLEKLKEFNKKVLDDKSKDLALKDSEVKVKTTAKNTAKTENDKNVNVKGNDDEIVNEKGKDYFDVDEILGKNLFWSNDSSNSDDSEDETAEDYYDEVNVHEKGICDNESDEKYKAEVEEFNDWYYRKLEERKYNVKVDDETTKLFDKVVKKPNIEKEMHDDDDLMYKQVCNEDEVSKGTDASRIVALLQAIFALLLVSGRTLHEQSILNSRLLKLCQPSPLSQLNHHQPETPLFPSAPCSCKTQSRVCCEVTTALIGKVSSMVNTASTGVVWLKRFCGAFYRVKQRTVRAVNFLGHVIVEVTAQDY